MRFCLVAAGHESSGKSRLVPALRRDRFNATGVRVSHPITTERILAGLKKRQKMT